MLAAGTAIDLVSLIEQKSGIGLTRRATTGNGEYWGMCPFCREGDNRFHVWPSSARPHYWCRVCRSSGDAIQFLRDYCALSYGDACLELGIDPDLPETTPTMHDETHDVAPSMVWQEAGLAFIERAEHFLWHPRSEQGQAALAYLRSRGLCDDTIRSARFGYCPLMPDGRWYTDSFESWGIDPDQLREDQREKGCVRIPNGIVIPWLEGERLWKLAIKRPGERMDYGQVLGSAEGLYGVDSIQYGKPVMMVEGEFDRESVMQEAGDLAACVATGSTTRGRSGRWLADLSLASHVLQSYDDDQAGDEGASYWLQTLPHAIRWRPWLYKDTNEMLQHPEKLQELALTSFRGWVQQGIWAAELPEPDTPVPKSPFAREIEPFVEPQTEEERLYTFASTISHIVDVFGGPDRVMVTKHDGSTLEQYLRTIRPEYSPVTLPKLPRDRCPHRSCRAKPSGANGWCEEHKLSHELLALGAKLGYPGLQIHRNRSIGAGVAQWEVYAEVAPEQWLLRDIKSIHTVV